jgi:hypothetical protein
MLPLGDLHRASPEPRDIGRTALRTAVAMLARPGPPPAGWLRQVGTLFAVWVLTTFATITFSLAVYGYPYHYFGEHRFGTVASVAMFLAAAWIASRIARRLAPQRFSTFWRIAAAGLFYLGFDDYFMVHENVDLGIHWLLGRDHRDPITDHIDDVIVVLYPVGAAIAVWPWRYELAALPWMIWSLIVAMAIFTGMTLVDWLDAAKAVEDSLKIAAGGAVLAAVLAAEGTLRGASSKPRV